MPETLDTTVSRTFDAGRLNAFANDPSVRPFVGGGNGYIDLSDAVADRDNIFLAGEHGAFAFSWTAPGTYEVHTFILPEGRGEWAARFARQARDFMEDEGAIQLWTRVPVGAENIRKFTLKAEFERVGAQTVLGVDYDLYAWRP